MRKFRQSRRWRRSLVAICLPYLLLSALVDFVHVHPPADAAVPATARTAVSATTQPTPAPDYTCTACLWLRSGLQLVAATGDSLAAGVTATGFVFAPDSVRPNQLVARSALLRGPPSSLLA